MHIPFTDARDHIVYTSHVCSLREIQKSIILVEGYRAARVIHVTMHRITSCAEIDSKVAGKNSCNAFPPARNVHKYAKSKLNPS